MLRIAFKADNVQLLCEKFKYKTTFACIWLLMGVIRYFGADNKYDYSIYHRNFNENLCWEIVKYILQYNIFIEFIGFSKLGLGLYFQLKLVYNYICAYVSDYRVDISGMPPI